MFARNFHVLDLLCASRKLQSKQDFINSQGKIYPCSKTNLGTYDMDGLFWSQVLGEKGNVNII